MLERPKIRPYSVSKFLCAAFYLSVASIAFSFELSKAVIEENIHALRHDRIPGNCGAAMDFLSKHSSEKRVQASLLAEYYRTPDAQSKEECMVLLCDAKDFVPDETFMREVIKRMHHYGKPAVLRSGKAAGDAGAELLKRNINRFADLAIKEVTENFGPKDNSLWVQSKVIQALAKAGFPNNSAKLFTSAYLERLVVNLQDDEIFGNAKEATAALFALGKIAVPALREAPRRSTLQGRQLALIVLSYANGKMTRKVAEDKAERIISSDPQ